MNYKKFLGAASAALMIAVVIFMLVPGAWAQSKYKTLYQFKFGKDGNGPGALISDAAGNLYGTTVRGGVNEYGIVFKLTPSADGSWAESVLHRFSTTNGDGAWPQGSLTLDAAGNLYGTTVGGGVGSCIEDYGCGTVFKLTPKPDGSWAETVLYKFTGAADGAEPLAGLIFDQAGNLYGTTQEGGGVSGAGTVFKLTPNPDGSWTEYVLYSFCSLTNCSDGAWSQANLIFDKVGNLYGTTDDGGIYGGLGGTVFKLTPNQDGSWSETVLHSFNNTNGDGQVPVAGLIFDAGGNLYGTTSRGGVNGTGTVFKLTPNADGSWTETVLHAFANVPDGMYPGASLIFDQTGNLYGAAAGGGVGPGTVFKLTPHTNGRWTETVLYLFCRNRNCSDGQGPSGVVLDKKGNLYGAASLKGAYGDGNVFKLTPSQQGRWTESVLHAFSDTTGDGWPTAGLVLDTAGNLYGTTPQGGTGSGKVFKLTPNPDGTWAESVLYQFTGGKDGGGPTAGLTFDQAGNLYGTTSGGGTRNYGTVFRLTPSQDGGWIESVLHSFTGGTDGMYPVASLIFDPAGNLYGTTQLGGGNCYNEGCATVFKLAPNAHGSWTQSVLYLFCSLKHCHDGAYPSFASLILDQAGNLYGTTPLGGLISCPSGCGEAYKLTPNPTGSWTETVIHNFTLGKDGRNPMAGMILDQSGNLYGTTQIGGAYGYGTVFELMPSSNGSWTVEELHQFTGGKDGGNPMASLIFDQVGNLYGTTQKGGASGYGVVFKLASNSNERWSETVLHAFANHTAADPVSGLILDAAGNLYGTAPGDGTTTHGEVFEITP